MFRASRGALDILPATSLMLAQSLDSQSDHTTQITSRLSPIAARSCVRLSRRVIKHDVDLTDGPPGIPGKGHLPVFLARHRDRVHVGGRQLQIRARATRDCAGADRCTNALSTPRANAPPIDLSLSSTAMMLSRSSREVMLATLTFPQSIPSSVNLASRSGESRWSVSAISESLPSGACDEPLSGEPCCSASAIVGLVR